MEHTPPPDPQAQKRSSLDLAPAESHGPSPFFGRQSQLAALRAAVDRSRRAPVVRVVDAPTGMGKSTLLRRFLRDLPATHPGAVALAGRYLERDDVRGGGLDGVAESLVCHLAALPPEVLAAVLPADVEALVRLFPALGGVLQLAPNSPAVVGPGEARRRGFSAFRELLARLGERWPLVLCVDDVQWSDADSAALVAALFDGPGAPSLLLVLACRREDLSRAPMLGRLLSFTLDDDPLDVGFVHVDGLSRAESRALAAALDGQDADGIAAEANGDPSFVAQLAQVGSAPGASLDAVIRARVAALPARARGLLEVVAVAGRPLRRAIALRAAEANEADVHALVDAHLARASDVLEPWHERVREAVLAGPDSAALRASHRRLAAALRAEAEPDAEAVAAHLVAAGDDAEAATWCARAGDAAMRAFAFDRASRHYAAALRGANDREIHVKRAEALAAAGRGAEAAREQLAAAALGDPVAGQPLRGEAALQLLVQGHVDEGRAVLVDALARIGLALPKSPWGALFSLVWRRALLRLRGLRFRRRPEGEVAARDLARIDTAWAGAVGLATFDQLRSAELHVRHLLLARHVGEPRRMARALSLELVHTSVAGSRRAAPAERLLALTGALVEEVGDPRVALRHAIDRGIAMFLLGRIAEARPLLEHADEALRTQPDGVGWERDSLARFLAQILAWQGDLRALAAHANARVRCAEARGDANISLHLRLRTHALLRLRDDAPEGVLDDLDELFASLARPGLPFPAFVHLLGSAEVELYEERPADAWNRVVRTWPTIARTGLFRVQVSRVEGAWLRGRCALAVLATLPAKDARRGRFEAIAWRERRSLAGERVAWASALGSVLEAVEARIAGKGGAAALLEAATALDACGLALHAACARLRAGEWNGRPDASARAWLTEQGVQDPDRFARLYVPGP